MSLAPAISRSFRRGRAFRRASIVGAATAAAMVLFAGPALAHITISPASVPPGSAAVLTFHVPNEEANADTVKVDILVPTAHPIAQFLVKPVAGWSISVRTIKLAKPIVSDDGTFSQAVSEVIWSGGQILPGQFQDFSISADPLPSGISQLAFKAIQTYSNGDTVRWIDLPQPGQAAPAHPAPILTFAAASTAPVQTARRTAQAVSSGTDAMARALALAGLLVGVLAGGLGLLEARRTRRLRAAGLDGYAVSARGADQAEQANGQASDLMLATAKTAGRRAAPGAKASSRRDRAPAQGSQRRNQSRRRG